MFQFLIGTIKTQMTGAEVDDERRFQFLIGTIKTNSTCKSITKGLLVSIPYRYYKNEKETQQKAQYTTRFNSL